MTSLRRLAALCLLSPVSLIWATAPDKKPIECPPSPTTQAELNACAQAEFEEATAGYAAAYKELMQSVGNQRRQTLRQAQVAWLQYRVKLCEFERSGVQGGSAAPLVYWSCQTRMTRERTAELRRYLTCQEGDLSCVRPRQ